MNVSRLLVFLVAGSAVACGASKAQSSGPSSPTGTSSSSSSTTVTTTHEPTTGGAGSTAAQPALPSPKVGTRALEKRSVMMNFDLTLSHKGASAGIQSGSWSIDEQRTEEVKAANGDAITKLQLMFGKRTAKPLLGLEQPSVTENKTYEIAGTGGTPSVTRNEKPAPDKERDAVLAEYGYVGSPGPLVTLLKGQKTGATLQPDAEARRVLIGVLPGIDENDSKVTVVYKGTHGDAHNLADLAVTMKGELHSGDMTFSLDLTGPAVVDLATGWVTELSLAGKVKAKGQVKHKKMKLAASGSGKMTVTRNAQFL